MSGPSMDDVGRLVLDAYVFGPAREMCRQHLDAEELGEALEWIERADTGYVQVWVHERGPERSPFEAFGYQRVTERFPWRSNAGLPCRVIEVTWRDVPEEDEVVCTVVGTARGERQTVDRTYLGPLSDEDRGRIAEHVVGEWYERFGYGLGSGR